MFFFDMISKHQNQLMMYFVWTLHVISGCSVTVPQIVLYRVEFSHPYIANLLYRKFHLFPSVYSSGNGLYTYTST